MPTMRRLLPALFLVAVSFTSAQAQINFAWNNCITQVTAAENKQYACDGTQNGIPYRMVASFLSPANLPEFVGVQMVIDFGTPGVTPIADWWRLGVGECRDGNLLYPMSFTGIGTGTTGVCRNPWAGANTGGGFQYTSEYGNPARARMLTAFARDTSVPLTTGQQYLAGVIGLDTFNDIDSGAGVCAGCCQTMLIVLNQVELYQVAGSPNGDIHFLVTPATRNFVTWNQQSNCPVPARSVTWGSIKATYR